MNNAMLAVIAQRQSNRNIGIYSVCSANTYVIEAALEEGKVTNTPVLIEATANQCNQFGGYTGMTPSDFTGFVHGIAEKVGFNTDMLILGGDHLGPLTWQDEPEASAIKKAEELIRQFVLAGYTKIHIDTSMMLADDDRSIRLSDTIIAKRAARLAKAAEKAYEERRSRDINAISPVYIIGSEVPVPGGTKEHEDTISVTTPEQLDTTYTAFKQAFYDAGLQDAFERVIGIVVQPGVEFGDEQIVEYDRRKAAVLTGAISRYDGIVLEGHSTDYQTRFKLKEMVEDGIAILKVGPALTFAMREALFALENIERELMTEDLSDFRAVLDQTMLQNPVNWKKYYHGDQPAINIKRKFSLSDRCRYYLTEKTVCQAIGRLIKNIDGTNVPLSLVSQYMPTVYTAIREGKCSFNAESMIKERIKECIREYLYASIEKAR